MPKLTKPKHSRPATRANVKADPRAILARRLEVLA